MLYQFNQNSAASDWEIVDDVVMGGKSTGKFHINEAGNGVFEGNVSLENNGGFSSLKHKESFQLHVENTIKINLKGDGKNYQFRVKANSSDRHSYIAVFPTSGEWEEIEVKLSEMYPAFRGQKLTISNFDQDQIQELAFLIGNKKEEHFHLEIKTIEFL